MHLWKKLRAPASCNTPWTIHLSPLTFFCNCTGYNLKQLRCIKKYQTIKFLYRANQVDRMNQLLCVRNIYCWFHGIVNNKIGILMLNRLQFHSDFSLSVEFLRCTKMLGFYAPLCIFTKAIRTWRVKRIFTY